MSLWNLKNEGEGGRGGRNLFIKNKLFKREELYKFKYKYKI